MSAYDINDILAKMQKEREDSMSQAVAERHGITQLLVKERILKLRIEFAGSGDSGSIDDLGASFEDGTNKSIEYGSELYNKVTEWAYKYLSGTNVDWYNNDGGQGHMEFDLSTVPYKFECSIDVNETVSSNAFSETTVA